MTLVMACGIEGMLPDGHAVGIVITAGLNTPDQIKEAMVENGIRAVQHKHPTVTDVQVTLPWHEYELPDEDEDEE